MTQDSLVSPRTVLGFLPLAVHKSETLLSIAQYTCIATFNQNPRYGWVIESQIPDRPAIRFTRRLLKRVFYELNDNSF